jgi:nucleotide-binding universal stress UspA family protein
VGIEILQRETAVFSGLTVVLMPGVGYRAAPMSDSFTVNRIVVAFDGSEMARRAFAYAVMLAVRIGCGVTALHVREVQDAPQPPDPEAGDIDMTFVQRPAPPRDPEALSRTLTAHLEDMEDYCEDRAVPFTICWRTGDLRQGLLGEAREADLLAVGRKGRMAGAGLGSLTRSLIVSSPCPVLLASGELRPIMRIVGVFDGSEQSHRALRFARGLARSCELPLTIVAASGVCGSADQVLVRAAELADGAAVLALGHNDLSEAEQILHAAEHTGFALSVLGAYPDSWLHQLMLGGSTGRVLRDISAPVVLVH